MSKVTSICGTPRGAGGICSRLNWPRILLSAAISRSPWKTRIVTAFWLSSAVEKIWLFLVGIVVLRSISRVKTPPSVSMPSDSGVTSSSTTSLTSPCSTPAWIAAPIATTSSGLTPLCGSLPKNLVTSSMTFGMRVMPPTSTTSSMSDFAMPASFSACWQGFIDRAIRSATRLSSLARVSFSTRCSGWCVFGSIEMNGWLISVWRRRRQLDLRLLGGLLQPLQRHLVLGQVDAVLLLELAREVLDDAHVEVFAAEEGVAVGRLHLEEALVDLEDRDVEGAAAEVIDRDRLGAGLVEAVGERRRRRLVDDAQHLEAGDLAGVLGRLALGVVEVGRHGDDRLAHLLAEVALGGLLHLLQDEGGNLAGGILLALHLDPGVAVRPGHDLVGHHVLVLGGDRVVVATADQALDGKDGVLGIGDRLALRGLADQALLVGEGDDRGRGPRPFGILDDPRLAAVHDGDAGVGGAEVDTDDF